MHGAHDNSVWDLAWHPIGYLLCRYLSCSVAKIILEYQLSLYSVWMKPVYGYCLPSHLLYPIFLPAAIAITLVCAGIILN